MKRVLLALFLFSIAPHLYAQKDTLVQIQTSAGTITVKLYEKTPLHRANFLKLVKAGYYDSLMFHRIIPEFMIQGGDPDSKKAPAGTQLGNGGPGYTIPAEIVPGYFHKKGALAAARLGDDVNPNKESSGSQFYLVQGRVFSENDLNLTAGRINNMNKQQAGQKLYNEYLNRPENQILRASIVRLQQAQKRDSLEIIGKPAIEFVNNELKKLPEYTFSPEQIKTYSTLGGAPHLDGNYTVFGEVVKGLEIIDKIAATERDANDRPKTDVRMFMVTKIEKK
jgi:cyclophilin family peptidyl-prolyl cis-trans isomerase